MLLSADTGHFSMVRLAIHSRWRGMAVAYSTGLGHCILRI